MFKHFIPDYLLIIYICNNRVHKWIGQSHSISYSPHLKQIAYVQITYSIATLLSRNA